MPKKTIKLEWQRKAVAVPDTDAFMAEVAEARAQREQDWRDNGGIDEMAAEHETQKTK